MEMCIPRQWTIFIIFTNQTAPIGTEGFVDKQIDCGKTVFYQSCSQPPIWCQSVDVLRVRCQNWSTQLGCNDDVMRHNNMLWGRAAVMCEHGLRGSGPPLFICPRICGSPLELETNICEVWIFTITRAFSCLNLLTSAFTFKTLLKIT